MPLLPRKFARWLGLDGQRSIRAGIEECLRQSDRSGFDEKAKILDRYDRKELWSAAGGLLRAELERIGRDELKEGRSEFWPIELARRIGGPEAVSALCAALTGSVRGRAARVALEAVDPEWVTVTRPALVARFSSMLDSEKATERVAGANGLGNLGDGSSFDKLLAVCERSRGNPSELREHLWPLAAVGKRRALPFLAQLVQGTKDDFVWGAVCAALSGDELLKAGDNDPWSVVNHDGAAGLARSLGITTGDFDAAFAITHWYSPPKLSVLIETAVYCHACGLPTDLSERVEFGVYGGREIACGSCGHRMSIMHSTQNADGFNKVLFVCAMPLTVPVGQNLRPIRFSVRSLEGKSLLRRELG